MKPAAYAKAIAAFITTTLGGLYVAEADNVLTLRECIGVAIASFAAFLSVYNTSNGSTPLAGD